MAYAPRFRTKERVTVAIAAADGARVDGTLGGRGEICFLRFNLLGARTGVDFRMTVSSPPRIVALSCRLADDSMKSPSLPSASPKSVKLRSDLLTNDRPHGLTLVTRS